MKKKQLVEKVWTLNTKDSAISDWRFTMDLRSAYEPLDDSTDGLEDNDKIDLDLLNNLVEKIKSYDVKLGSIKTQEYDIVLHFLEHSKTVIAFEKAWDKFQEYMVENKVFIKSRTINTDK